MLESTSKDKYAKQAYPRVKKVYLVSEAVHYETPVRLYAFGVKVNQVGTQVTNDQFDQILAAAGVRVTYTSSLLPSDQPLDHIELERVLATVRVRMQQGAFRQSILEQFGGVCVITACDVKEVLEAAHIDPWCSSLSNHTGN